MNVLLRKSETTLLVEIDWRGIRREYFKVWADFPTIAHPFGITLSDRQLNAIGHMLAAMDLIDSAIDRESCEKTRIKLCESILTWMADKTDACPLPSKLDETRLTALRQTIHRQDAVLPFLAAAANVFRASELKRNSRTASALIKHLIDEGQSAAEMTLQILGPNSNAGLNNFLQRIMRIGTIVDTLLDADDDFEQGVLRMNPGFLFRLRLCVAVARQLPGLIWGFPDRALLWQYCWSYTKSDLRPVTNKSG